MTFDEYLGLKTTLVQGCMIERVQFLATMGPRQFSEFIGLLELSPTDRLCLSTWRAIARIAGGIIDGLMYGQEDPPCPDRFNPDCECEHCDLDTVDVLAVERRREAVQA